ncbi:MAG TPA: hypothetical protein P5204_05575 [Kiritimatiellia bacterium]|jgi:hypothetical protein|nr:hypothetical protein [Kiritimatiellia bacterium]
MTFDFHKIMAGKRAHRQRLATLPIGEKLRLLDELRAREIALRGTDKSAKLRTGMTREPSVIYGTSPKIDGGT